LLKGVGFWCLDSRKPSRSLVLRGFAIGGDFFFNLKGRKPNIGAAFSQITNTFKQRLAAKPEALVREPLKAD
jgi:hypothetical protein